MYTTDKEERSNVDRIKRKILKSVIGENCEDVYCAIAELGGIHVLAENAIITEQNPAE